MYGLHFLNNHIFQQGIVENSDIILMLSISTIITNISFLRKYHL